MDDNRGTSIVILNSFHGVEYFKKIVESIKYESFEYNQIVKYNYSYLNSAKEPDNRKIFFRYIKKYDFDIAYIKLKKNIQDKKLQAEIKKDINNFRLRRMSRKIILLLRNK